MTDIAFEALARGDAPAALAAAEAAVLATPDSSVAHQALGLAQQMSGDLSAAVASMEHAISLAPDRAELHFARARMAIRQSDSATADASLSDALRADPNALPAYLTKLHLALNRSQPDEAERQLRLAQRVSPDHPQVIAAEGALALMRRDGERALKLFTLAATALPNDPLVLAGLGLSYRVAKNYAFAEAALVRAIALQPDAVALRWALIESLRAQNREDEALEPLRELLLRVPNDRGGLALLGDLLSKRGEFEPALAAYQKMIVQPPLNLPALDRLLQRLIEHGLGSQAVDLSEQVIAAFPADAGVWQRRVQLARPDAEAMDEVLARWQLAQPKQPQALAMRAELEEWRGDLALGESLALEVLATAPDVVSAEAIVLRAELLRDPQAALRRIERLLEDQSTQQWQRPLRFWRALAFDRLNRPENAMAAWADMWVNTSGGFNLPALPAGKAEPAESTVDGEPPKLLWAPPGGRPREVLAMLTSVAGLFLLQDRFTDFPRQDGLGPLRADGSMVDRAGWRAHIEQRGVDPARSIDWLPHWDARLAAALPGAKLIAVISDPRDLLMNWMAFSSSFPLRFIGVQTCANWLRELLEPLALRLESEDADLLVIRDVELCSDPVGVAKRLQSYLNLDALPNADAASDVRKGLGGQPECFAPGHWRQYQGLLGQAFDSLSPLAMRLGFGAD